MTSKRFFNNVDEAVVAAFDTVYSLKTKENKGLHLKFAYVQLKHATDALDSVKDAGYMNTYLNAKKNASHIPRCQLSDDVRRGRRWSGLTGPTPFQLAIYTRSAGTIVYVLLLSSAIL